MQDGQLGRSRNTVAVGEPVAGLKRDCSLAGKIDVLHTLVVGSSPACSKNRSYNGNTWVCKAYYDSSNLSLSFLHSSVGRAMAF